MYDLKHINKINHTSVNVNAAHLDKVLVTGIVDPLTTRIPTNDANCNIKYQSLSEGY